MAGDLIRVVMPPLSEYTPDFEARIDVVLVPVNPNRPAEYLVWVNVPVLHPLHPVDRTVPVLERLVDMAPVFVVVLHVGIHLASDVSHGPCEQALSDVGAYVVQVVFVVVNSTREVVHVHYLAPSLGTAVLVEQGVQSGGP